MNFLKFFLIFNLAVIICFSCSPEPTCRDLEKDFFLLTKNLRTKDDTLQFVESLDKLILNNSACLKAVQLSGYFSIASADYRKAKGRFLQAVRIDSTDPYTLYYLGMLYNFEAKNAEAVSFLNKALEYKNKDGIVIDRNNLFFDKLDIKYDQVVHLRAIVLFESGFYEKSKSGFLYCIDDNFSSYDTYGYMAAIYAHENKMDSACLYHRKSLVGGSEYIIDTSLIDKCEYSIEE